MKIEVYNTQMKKVGQLELPDEIFAVEVKKALLWESVKQQRASRRRGTHKTKDRGEVSGGGAKPFRQKGTGRARQGSDRAPNMVGGGTVFGPRPRDYSYRLPRSARRAALRAALSLRAQDGALVVLEDFALEAPKTKSVAEFIGKLDTQSALIVDAANENLKRSSRNLQKSRFVEAGGLNVYDILDHDKLVLTKAALEAVQLKAQKKPRTAASEG